MRYVLQLLMALMLLVPGVAIANLGTLDYDYGYAYPVPWSPAGGPLTLFYQSLSDDTPVFTVVDTMGDEVVRLTGALINQRRAEDSSYGEFPYVYEFEATWDGCNATGRPVNAGTYLCYVRSTVFRFIVVR